MSEVESGESAEVPASASDTELPASETDDAVTTEVDVSAVVPDADQSLIPQPTVKSGWGRFFVRAFLALIVPVTLGVAASWWLVRDLPNEQMLHRGGTMLSSGVAARNVADALATRVDVLRTLTSQGTVPNEIAIKNEQYRGTPEVIASIIRGVDEQWREAFAVGAAPPRPVAENQGSQALRSFRSLFPGYVSLLAMDQHGAVTSSTEVTPKFDYSGESWFQNVISSGQIEMTTLFDEEYQALLSVAVPMQNTAGRPSGVLRAIVDPQSVVAGAVDDLEAEDFNVIVIGRDGELLFRSKTASGAAPIDASLLSLASADDVSTAARRVRLGDGHEVYAAAAAVPDLLNVDVGAGLDWRVLVVRDSVALAGLVAEQKRQRDDLLFVVSMLALGTSLILAWWLSLPFRRLAEVPTIVAQEEWERRLGSLGGVPPGLVTSINELLNRTEVSERRHAKAQAVVRDAESISAQAERFSAGDRLTAFASAGPELAPLAESLEALRDDLSRQLAKIDDGVREASDLDKTCRQHLSWADTEEANLRRGQKLKTEAKSLGVELAEIANQSGGLLDELEQQVEDFRDQTASFQEAMAGQLSQVASGRDAAETASVRSRSQLEEVNRSVALLSELSDRTGVLALNGSIQAALAGDSGRGFALIASEVEQLSRQAIELAARASTKLTDVAAESDKATAQLAALDAQVGEVRAMVESSGEQNYSHLDRAEALRQSLLSESKRSRQSGQSSQAMALELETHAEAFAAWKQNAERAREEREKVGEALSELGEFIATLQGRQRTRRPLSLVSAPADLIDASATGTDPIVEKT